MSASSSTPAPAHGRLRRLRRLRGLRVLVLFAVVLGAVLSCQPLGGAQLPPPPTTPVFGPAIEPLAAYVPGTTCNPTPKPGVVAFKDMILKHYGGADWGIGNNNCGVVQEHKEGRAWDWHMSVFNPSDVAKVNSLLNWLFATDQYGNKYAMVRRLGIMYIGWNQQIWGSYQPQDGWRPMSDRGSITQNHKDHVHFSFSWDGALKKTSFWKAPTYSGPPPLPSPTAIYKTSYNSRQGTVQLPFTVVAGRRYLVWARGSYFFHTTGADTGYGADAECAQANGAWSERNLADWVLRTDSYQDLKVNGMSSWIPTADTGGGCNAKDHVYMMGFTATKTEKATLRIVDADLGDNRGSLALEFREYIF